MERNTQRKESVDRDISEYQCHVGGEKSDLAILRYYSNEFQKQLILSLVGSVLRNGLTIEDWHGRIFKELWFKTWDKEVLGGFLDPDKSYQILSALLRCPIFVEAQETLERQRIQQGVYMLVPNEVVKNDGNYVINPKLPRLNVKDSNIGQKHWYRVS